ncbi:MAG TPA: translation elongation factor Ts [Dongiaceae bacterium]|nr:translation elongation factor Ts [Dongiaceae bacterium]
MAEITAALVKELREISGAGMMDCKKALVETSGDLEQASDWLRKKGLAAAAKKAGRVAAEGLVGAVAEGTKGALVEVNCETDFVARNEQFQGFVGAVTKLALGASDIGALKTQKLPGEGHTVAEKLTQLVATIGENMQLRRTARLSVSDGVVASYVHNAIIPGLGKIGVLVGLESGGDKAKLAALGKQLAMHVAHSNPQAMTADALDPAAVERERGVLAEQAKASGKPAEIVAKMVEGGLRKYYEAWVLPEQIWVMDNKSRVKQVIEAAGKELGTPVRIAGFARFALGEGIDKGATDAA